MGIIKPERLRHVADPTSVQVTFPELAFSRGAVSPKSSWTLCGQAQIISAAPPDQTNGRKGKGFSDATELQQNI